MRRADLLAAIATSRVIAILRSMPLSAATAVPEALVAGGVRVREITAAVVPSYLRILERPLPHFPICALGGAAVAAG
jgi:2-keto-3-deoxy-6-phosphogluconate aldolase